MKTAAICLTIAICFILASLYVAVEIEKIVNQTTCLKEKTRITCHFEEAKL